MNILNSYLRSKMDLSHIGFQRGSKEGGYFCTPLHSRVIGWTGVDGIHFCTVKGLDDIIFAVNPTYEPGDYVHPVARNFEDFLRLILAFGSAELSAQSARLSENEYGRLLELEWRRPHHDLDGLGRRLFLTPIQNPFTYTHMAGQLIDCTRIVRR